MGPPLVLAGSGTRCGPARRCAMRGRIRGGSGIRPLIPFEAVSATWEKVMVAPHVTPTPAE